MTPEPSRPLPADLAWAAYLLSSWWDAAGTLSAPAAPADAAGVVEILRRNGVPLLTLADDPRPAAAELLAAEPLQAAFAADRAKMAGQQAAFGEIVATWRVAGIPALFVKALGPRPTFPYVSNNLDVLVPQAQQDAARKIVRDMGFVELRHIEEPNKFLLRRYHLGASAFDIHIHGRLEWHTEFVDSPRALTRGVYAPDCTLATVPVPEDGLLIALAHAVYENKALKLIELGKLIYAARLLRVDWEAVAEGARRRGWLPGLWFALALCARWEARLYGTTSLPEDIQTRAERRTPAWLHDTLARCDIEGAAAPIRLPFVQSKRLFYAKMLTDPSLALGGRARDVVSHTLYGTRVRLRLRSQRPLLIALDGIDGSGKSAQAALLAQALEGAALRHRVVWTRGGSSPLLRPLLALGKRLAKGTSAPHAPASSAPSPQPSVPNPQSLAIRETERARLFQRPLVRCAWPWLIALELSASFLARVGWPLLRGEVVVADRYVLTALIELAARLGRPDIARTPAARLLRRLAPQPGCSYWLDVPVAAALARKADDESAPFLAQQAALSPALAAELGAARWDAAQSLAALSDRLVTEALRSYEDAHWTVLNGLFWSNPRPLPAAWRQQTRKKDADSPA